MKRIVSLIVIALLYCSMIFLFTSKVYAQSAPVITSVSPIVSTTLSQNIYINGSGFGNTQPQTVSLGDGSVDTVVNNTTPSLAVGDIGKWGAGLKNDSVTYCTIGVVINSWSDSQIVLGGFGSALGVNGQGTWNIATGDILTVQVYTPYGHAFYNVTVTTIPEFPSSLILPPFMIATLLATLLAVVVYRRKIWPDSTR